MKNGMKVLLVGAVAMAFTGVLACKGKDAGIKKAEAGLNYKFYQRVETGRSNLTLKTISKISNVLKIHPRAFFK